MKASDVMKPGVATVRTDQPACAAAELLLREGISGAAVIDYDNRPAGVVTLADLAAHSAGLERSHPARHPGELSTAPKEHREWLQGYADPTPVGIVMTPFLVRVAEDTPLDELISLMVQAQIHRVFVTRGDQLVGVVSSLDLAAKLGELLAAKEGAPR